MQQDDEVGKVATASPIVMAKATELFLQEMLNSIEREVRAKSTKKVSMYHVYVSIYFFSPWDGSMLTRLFERPLNGSIIPTGSEPSRIPLHWISSKIWSQVYLILQAEMMITSHLKSHRRSVHNVRKGALLTEEVIVKVHLQLQEHRSNHRR